jgi:sugar lactone lactonase YvrE
VRRWDELGVTVDGLAVRVSAAGGGCVVFRVPRGVDDGELRVALPGLALRGRLRVAPRVAAGFHAVTNPVVGPDGMVYTTVSGVRGQSTTVSVVRIDPRQGELETFAAGLLNATGLAFDPAGRLLVTARGEGNLYRLDAEGRATLVAENLGVPTGLLVDTAGYVLVGDRQGRLLELSPGGKRRLLRRLPPSISAYHLTWLDGETMAMVAPTLSSEDPLYLIDRGGRLTVRELGFCRPQGIVGLPGARGVLVAGGYGGRSGVFHVPLDGAGRPRHLLAAPDVVGLAIGGEQLYIATSESLYRIPLAALDPAWGASGGRR